MENEWDDQGLKIQAQKRAAEDLKRISAEPPSQAQRNELFFLQKFTEKLNSPISVVKVSGNWEWFEVYEKGDFVGRILIKYNTTNE